MAKRKIFSRSHLVLATVVLASLSAAVPAMGAQGSSAFTKPGGPTHRAPKPTATQGQGAAVLSAAASPQVIELMKKQEILDKLVDRITGGRSESNRDQIPGFSEVEVDAAASRITLHWKGDLPEFVNAVLRDLPQGVTTQVVSAKYSKAELHAAREKLLPNGKPLPIPAKRASHINRVGPAADGSGLEIGYETDDARAADPLALRAPLPADELSPQVAAITSAVAGVEVHARYEPQVTDLTRGADWDPWAGGAGVQTPGGGICSTGFGVYSPSLYKDLVTTAWHCGEGSYNTWYSREYLGNAYRNDGLDTDDVIGIVPKNNGHSSAWVYDGAWNDDSNYAKPVSGAGYNNVGDYVCQSAANSGVHCGLQVKLVDQHMQGPNGVWRKFQDKAVQTDPNDIAAANGDSGGPVFALTDGGGKDQARGTITSLDNTRDCQGRQTADAGYRTPWCLSTIWYVPINQILADMGWVLKTG
ncbi:trypsin-like serine protease [Kitasatospora sp. NPDC059973]|uniref:trypsin-like serine protease n=1 Tax=Kitasatospora sp. NPDC059973 TaxID=3347020 RepID=UPI00367E80D8